jgi:hypothetical protein
MGMQQISSLRIDILTVIITIRFLTVVWVGRPILTHSPHSRVSQPESARPCNRHVHELSPIAPQYLGQHRVRMKSEDDAGPGESGLRIIAAGVLFSMQIMRRCSASACQLGKQQILRHLIQCCRDAPKSRIAERPPQCLVPASTSATPECGK